MSRPGLLPLAELFAGLSLISVGGANVLFPSIRHAVVDRNGWLDVREFGHLFALSQAAPGPNVMLSSIVGWQVLGLAGLVVATLAILLPSSLLAFAIGRLVRTAAPRSWLGVATIAVVPLAMGLMLASAVIAAKTAHAGLVGYAIAALAAATVLWTRINPLFVMIGGTVVFSLSHASVVGL